MNFTGHIHKLGDAAPFTGMDRPISIWFRAEDEKQLIGICVARHDSTVSVSIVDGKNRVLLETLLDVLDSKVVTNSTRIMEKPEEHSFSRSLWLSVEKRYRSL